LGRERSCGAAAAHEDLDGALAELEQRASEVERQAQAAATTANRASQETARAEAVASREPELEANLAAAWKQALSSIAWR